MSPHRPRPITVENSWLNKSLEERIAILRHCSAEKAEAISILVNEALKDEWRDIGHTPTHGEPYTWKCDEPGVVLCRSSWTPNGIYGRRETTF